VAVVLPHRSFLNTPRRWFDLCNQLAAANVSYRLLLAGDELVDHPLTAEALRACPVLLIPERGEFLPADRQLVEMRSTDQQVYAAASEVLANVKPAVETQAEGVVRALPRIAAGSAVVHLLNYAYDARSDDVTPLKDVQVRWNLRALGIPDAAACQFLSPDAPPQRLVVDRGTVIVPALGLWGLLAF